MKTTYKKAKKIVRSLGFSIEDGLGFTVGGNRLVNGEECPSWLSRLNGCDVFEIIKAVKKSRNKGVKWK